MFPTTVWTTIRQAGALDRAAQEEFAQRYRPPVLDYVRGRGFRGSDADDLCQEVFLRVFQRDVLVKADRERGRFRSLLRTVALHTIQDRMRKRSETPAADLDPADSTHPGGSIDAGREFDETWALHLVQRALNALRDQGSPYYSVLVGHLDEVRQDRNKLWIARRKLTAEIRREIASTCATPADIEEELRDLAPFLSSSDVNPKKPGKA